MKDREGEKEEVAPNGRYLYKGNGQMCRDVQGSERGTCTMEKKGRKERNVNEWRHLQ